MAAEIKRLFEGKWTVVRSEDFDKFLDKMDVGFLKKKLAMSLTPSLTVAVEGETITVTFSAGPKSNRSFYTLGSKFEMEGDMGGNAVASFSDGKWITEIKPKDPKKGKEQTQTREIIDGELVQTMVIEDVICKRYFKKA